MTELVLSLFPGVDLLGLAFGLEGFCVVTGPDLITGRDIRTFTGCPGRFDGVIGGPPCQDFSCARRGIEPTGEGLEMLRQFLRVVSECDPTWFLVENVPGCPDLQLAGYGLQRFDLTDYECGGVQFRRRHFFYGSRDSAIVRPARQREVGRYQARAVTLPAVTRGVTLSYAEACRRQGLQVPLRLPGQSRAAKVGALANGVPLLMGLVVAQAVKRPGPVTPADCVCGCGRGVTPPASHAGPACRKRMERRRRGGRPVVCWPPQPTDLPAAESR